jgi:hypothetical protein
MNCRACLVVVVVRVELVSVVVVVFVTVVVLLTRVFVPVVDVLVLDVLEFAAAARAERVAKPSGHVLVLAKYALIASADVEHVFLEEVPKVTRVHV